MARSRTGRWQASALRTLRTPPRTTQAATPAGRRSRRAPRPPRPPAPPPATGAAPIPAPRTATAAGAGRRPGPRSGCPPAADGYGPTGSPAGSPASADDAARLPTFRPFPWYEDKRVREGGPLHGIRRHRCGSATAPRAPRPGLLLIGPGRPAEREAKQQPPAVDHRNHPAGAAKAGRAIDQ